MKRRHSHKHGIVRARCNMRFITIRGCYLPFVSCASRPCLTSFLKYAQRAQHLLARLCDFFKDADCAHERRVEAIGAQWCIKVSMRTRNNGALVSSEQGITQSYTALVLNNSGRTFSHSRPLAMLQRRHVVHSSVIIPIIKDTRALFSGTEKSLESASACVYRREFAVFARCPLLSCVVERAHCIAITCALTCMRPLSDQTSG